MLNAFVLGAVSQLSLILSGLTVFLVSVPKRLVGALAAFGAGALIAAVDNRLMFIMEASRRRAPCARDQCIPLSIS
jgi:hypothetical protein